MLLAVALVAALGPLALAQRGGGGGGGGGGMGGGMPGGGMGRGPAVDRMETIAKELKLTDAQKTDVEAILNDGAKQSSDLIKKLGELRQSIMNQDLNGKDSSASLKQLADLTAQITANEVTAYNKILAKLDEKQKAKGAKLFDLINKGFVAGNWRTVR
jgi:Spy/CpxP family protein refolding chaperone